MGVLRKLTLVQAVHGSPDSVLIVKTESGYTAPINSREMQRTTQTDKLINRVFATRGRVR